MDCPTCFQKHIAPPAPSPSSTIIPTGQRIASFAAPRHPSVEARRPTNPRIPTTPAQAADSPSTSSGKPILVIIVVVIVIAAAAAGVFVFLGKKSKSAPPTATTTETTAETTTDTAQSQAGDSSSTTEKSAPLAPASDDANWTFDLGGLTIPSGPVQGRIHGQQFVSARTTYQNGSLTFRDSTSGSFEFGVMIDFHGESPDMMAGKSFNISNTVDQATKVSMRWRDSGQVKRKSFQDNYAMRVDFGAFSKNHLHGKIYLCTPDTEKSYVMGAFDADARAAKPKN